MKFARINGSNILFSGSAHRSKSWCRNPQTKVAKFARFALVMEAIRNRRATALCHSFGGCRMIEYPADAQRQRTCVTRFKEEPGAKIPKKWTNRRKVARNHGETAGPVFENLHGNIDAKFWNVLQRAYSH